MLDWFVANPERVLVKLPGSFGVPLMRLLDDGILRRPRRAGITLALGDLESSGAEEYPLTEKGIDVVSHIREAQLFD